MKKMLIIDGNSLLFRSFYATSFPGATIMTTKEGIPTNALFAFSNMINKILNEQKEEFNILVAFDTGHKTFRHQELETYKANRKPCPPELVTQMPLARELLKKMGIFIYEQEGVEGDDIAGTVAKKAASEGYDVLVYTSDRDFLQLIDTNIHIDILKKGLSDTIVFDDAKMKEIYGFTPLQIQDYKGLMGDPSDNLPGIPGVGEKTALKLIQEYGSLEKIIEAAPQMKSKLGEKIVANQELGKLCKHLAIIKTDVELPFMISDTLYNGYDYASLHEFCVKYELKQLLARISPNNKVQQSEEITINSKTISSIINLNIPNEFGLALDYDLKKSYFKADVYGLSISFGNDSYYMSIEDVVKDNNLINILQDNKYLKDTYDYKAIRGALSRYNILIEGLKNDILIAYYLLDSSQSNDINSVLSFYGLAIKNDESVDLLSNGNKSFVTQLSYYAHKLGAKIAADLIKEETKKIYDEIEIPLVTVLSNMEIEGFPLNKDELLHIGESFKTKLKEATEEIYQVVGHEFNISSPKQVGEVLFNELGLDSNKKGSTSVEVLNSLKDKHPVVPLLLTYRKYAKLCSTYIDGLADYIFEDGKLHAIFNQATTTTGRLSSSEPNLQNISVRDEESKAIRKAFFYKQDGISILSLDYSQIELRLLASMSHCQKLINTFNEGEDIHSETARAVFHIEGDVPSAYRRKAKAVNFGIVYGISEWGLSEQIGVAPKEAKEIIQNFYNSYPEVGTFLREIISNVQDKGYVRTMLGRKRYLREIFDSNYMTREFAKRAAMNAPIQGTAADLIKIAMIKVSNSIKEHNLKSRMISQVHDELIFKAYDDEIEILTKIVKASMEHAMDLDVKLEVDGGHAKTWFDAK